MNTVKEPTQNCNIISHYTSTSALTSNMLNIIRIFIATKCVVVTKVYAFSPHFAAVRQRSLSLRMSIPTPIDTVTSGLASICRIPFGVTVRKNNANIDDETSVLVVDLPIRIKVLYDIENSQIGRAHV